MKKSTLGIDVSKKELVCALLIVDKTHRASFANNLAGYKKLDGWIKQKTEDQPVICMESTGPYSEGLALYLHSYGYMVSIVNPFCIKSYASSKLTRHKNDQVDALVIARYARIYDLIPYSPRNPTLQKLQDLYRCEQDLKLLHNQVGNHLEDKNLAQEVIKLWEVMLIQIQEKITSLDKQMSELINDNPDLQENHKNLQTIDGIGSLTAMAIMAELPDISFFRNARQLAAYAGVTPKHRLSGTSVKGQSRISKIGSAKLRKALYFPAISAIQHNLPLKQFYLRLKAKGKHTKAIICAVMRKLLHVVYAVLKHKVKFDENFASKTGNAVA